jgi:hypothetical protein
MIKGKKGNRVLLRDIQPGGDYNKVIKHPVHFYNTHVRKEGQKVLTEEEYTEMIKKYNNITSLKEDIELI